MKTRILGAVVGMAALLSGLLRSNMSKKLRAVGPVALLVTGIALVAPAPASAVAAAPAPAVTCGMRIEVKEASYTVMSGFVYYTNCTTSVVRVKIAKKGGDFTSCKAVNPRTTVSWSWISIWGVGYPAGVRGC